MRRGLSSRQSMAVSLVTFGTLRIACTTPWDQQSVHLISFQWEICDIYLLLDQGGPGLEGSGIVSGGDSLVLTQMVPWVARFLGSQIIYSGVHFLTTHHACLY